MPGPTIDSNFQVLAPTNAPAAVALGPNTRVRGTFGRMATAVDFVVLTPPPFIQGNYVAPNTRTFVQGVPMISASAQSLAFVPGTPPPPPIVPAGVMLFPAANPRVIST